MIFLTIAEPTVLHERSMKGVKGGLGGVKNSKAYCHVYNYKIAVLGIELNKIQG